MVPGNLFSNELSLITGYQSPLSLVHSLLLNIELLVAILCFVIIPYENNALTTIAVSVLAKPVKMKIRLKLM